MKSCSCWRRRELVRGVIRFKERENLILRNAQREEQLLARLIRKGREQGLDAHSVTKIFHEIIDDSVRSQQLFLQKNLNPDLEHQTSRIAFQGQEGNFSHLAAQKFFAERFDEVSYLAFPTFADVVEAVEGDRADFGLLPVENTTAGGINEVYDLLLRAKLSIVGEEVFQITHCLLAIEDVPLSKIRRVLSQWQALAQCTRFLSQLENCQRESLPDTAMAARRVREDQDLSQAAIGGEDSAQYYGLKVLARNISDQTDNFTRFLVVAANPVDVDQRIPSKTSLIVATADEAGALMKALVVLQRHGINMTKLESRPKSGSRFEYLFYIDFEGNCAEPRIRDALVELRGVTSFLKILGSYPLENRERTAPTVEAIVQPAKTGTENAVRKTARLDGTRATPCKLASRATKPNDSVVRLRGVSIGGADFCIIAGPGIIESEEQIRACARQVKECGGRVLFGGCFRPPTSPYGFQGLGQAGLEMLAMVGREYDLPVATEVFTPSEVQSAASLADLLLIGPQNMHNVGLLTEIGNVNRAVMLMRGISASLDQLLGAAEYILARGNQQVMLCERGISTFETTTRYTLDLGAIPILRQMTHLPIVVDPSHAAGQRDLVFPLALAAHAVRPHAMILEIHPQPQQALNDESLALDFDTFRELAAEMLA